MEGSLNFYDSEQLTTQPTNPQNTLCMLSNQYLSLNPTQREDESSQVDVAREKGNQILRTSLHIIPPTNFLDSLPMKTYC